MEEWKNRRGMMQRGGTAERETEGVDEQDRNGAEWRNSRRCVGGGTEEEWCIVEEQQR